MSRFSLRVSIVEPDAGRPLTAAEIFDAFYGASSTAFWLDSGRADSGRADGGRVDGELGRFSMVGDASGPLARVVTADVWRGEVTVSVPSDATASGTTVVPGGLLDFLADDLASYSPGGSAAVDFTGTDIASLPFGFVLGWVGYLGYELKAECGAAVAHRSPDPDAALIFADRALVIDHQTGRIYALALEPADSNSDWSMVAAQRMRKMAANSAPSDEGDPTHRADWLKDARLTEVALRHDRRTYLELIRRCQQAIEAGESYEICLTNMLAATGSIDPLATYRRLRSMNPAPFGALLRFDQLAVLSTSMERFLRVDSGGRVESRPIKGTRPRSADRSEDEWLRKDLGASEKDRAENLMIVDLVRNDLARCAEIGSVQVPELFTVASYATVHQLVSTVRAQLRPDLSTVDCVRAAFPGGSMTGAPKPRTMELLDEYEAGPRGVYSGAIGYFSLTGAADLSIVIRTLVANRNRLTYGVGGAIIAPSDPVAEFEETAVKAAAFTSLFNIDFPRA